MKLFYMLLFGGMGIAFIAIAAAGAKWYFGYASRRPLLGRFGAKGARIITGVIGALLIAYGILYYVGII